jgi:C4-dicarboxylate-specific signal transduction histidine kinase
MMRYVRLKRTFRGLRDWTTVGAMAASIAHEINQPLGSIVMNGNAGLRWLARSEPNLEEVRVSLERIVNDGHRAAQIIAGIQAMFRKESTERSAVAVNELICDVVATSVSELKSRHVSLALQLFDDLPPVPADRVQLQQVLANLIMNAIDSMTSVPGRPHILTVRSERLDEWVLISRARFRHRDCPRASRTHIRGLLHHQTRRYRVRLVHKPLDH